MTQRKERQRDDIQKDTGEVGKRNKLFCEVTSSNVASRTMQSFGIEDAGIKYRFVHFL